VQGSFNSTVRLKVSAVSREPYITAKEPYITAKEPHLSAKEPYTYRV